MLIWYTYKKNNGIYERKDQFGMSNIWLTGLLGKEDKENNVEMIKDKVPKSPSKLKRETNLIKKAFQALYLKISRHYCEI